MDTAKPRGRGGLAGSRLRWLLVPLIVVPLIPVLSVGLGRNPSNVPSALIGQPAPTFALSDLDGRVVGSAALRDTPMVVNFWASWCTECKREHPVLMDGYRRYGERVAFIGVLYQDRVEDALLYLAGMGDAGYPNLIDPAGRLALDFGVFGVPETFFVDAQGVVRFKHWGALTREVLDEQIQQLLVEEGGRL